MYYGRPVYYRPPRPYGCGSFLLDAFLTIFTGGLWLIWIFVREFRNSRFY